MAEDERGIGGRKPNPLVWTIKTYKDKNYYTCKTLKLDGSNGTFGHIIINVHILLIKQIL